MQERNDIGFNKRQECRDYFAELGLTYNDITINDLHILTTMLNRNFAEEAIRLMKSGEPIYWKRVNDAKRYKGVFSVDGEFFSAYLTGKGGYFTAREVISFTQSGFIGFCGEADNNNAKPVLEAFKEWCDYLKGKKAGNS